ncbi:MAG: helix-turn-helix domain-containing protein [Gemmatimonadaceae bacterium]|nr:helix-turn-helix domain-containing protein [Gemmatimonadaceae bacterium]
MRFGSYSLILLVGAINGWVLAALLWRRRANVLANRLLGTLVALVALRLMPYVLGYAGGYDLYPWLTFAPFDLSFAFGPLIWAYVVALTTGAAPRRWRRHAVAPAVQLTYALVCFSLPLRLKWSWYSGTNLQIIEPAGLLIGLLSLGGYLLASWRHLAGYQRWLHTQFSNTETWRLDWLHHLLAGVAATLLIGVAFALVSWIITPLDYFQRFPQMIVFAVLAYFLGALGWRFGDIVYPVPVVAVDSLATLVTVIPPEAFAEPVSVNPQESAPADSAYEEVAERWAARTWAAGWWRDDTLSLTSLAARLNTSPRTVSRVLNEGRGQTFHAFVNRMRIDAVVAALHDASDERDLVVLAFDAGFNSKASFNRAFKAQLGVTPSQYRAAARTGSVPIVAGAGQA